MEDILAKIQEYLPIALQVIGAFAAIATVTKNKADNKVADFLLQAINFLGMNIGKSNNDPKIG